MEVYTLENWSFGSAEGKNPWAAPEMHYPRLFGEVYGNPRFKDGKKIGTSAPVDYDEDEDAIITESGSRYKLGVEHPEYAELFPDAKKRLVDSILKQKSKKQNNETKHDILAFDKEDEALDMDDDFDIKISDDDIDEIRKSL